MKLTTEQKSVLKGFSHIFAWEELPSHVVAHIVELNRYETIHHDINRYLSDQFLATRFIHLRG